MRLCVLVLLGLLTAVSATADEVIIGAAASLADVLREIGRSCEASSGHKVVLNLGSSSALARQILAGAPDDLFFSADEAQMDVVERAGFVKAEERVEVLSNTLAVIVPAESRREIHSPSDLRSVAHLALADPQAVPAGVYAKEYLQSKGLWDGVKDRVVPTMDVRAALAAVASGNADAGIVYRTDARDSPRVRIALEVPREDGPRIVYVLAPLARSTKAATRVLERCLRSPEAITVYERFGFLMTSGR